MSQCAPNVLARNILFNFFLIIARCNYGSLEPKMVGDTCPYIARRGFSAEERQTQPASGPTVQCCSGTCFLHSGTRSMSIQFFMKL